MSATDFSDTGLCPSISSGGYRCTLPAGHDDCHEAKRGLLLWVGDPWIPPARLAGSEAP